ncbi:hypothetical protein ABLE93_21060 [Xanthobacter sp. KR7-65]|uniref:hypothetical protein n=1 Tax=Xanthobacter sp. KR7-65 TaxID=3156612 RepID=UPI0032B4CC75
MLKIAILVWLMLATTLAGAAVLAVLAIPSFSGEAMRLIPLAAGGGALVAVPFAFLIARRILALSLTRG